MTKGTVASLGAEAYQRGQKVLGRCCGVAHSKWAQRPTDSGETCGKLARRPKIKTTAQGSSTTTEVVTDVRSIMHP